MAVTLQKLYDDVKDQEIELIAGEKGMSNIVRWVYMVESGEISGFLDGQEVAFTTGVGLENEGDLFQLVRTNYQNKASGMVINEGPYIHGISREIIDFCNEKNFPLFRAPWHVHMAVIMKQFCQDILLAEKITIELQNAVYNAICYSQRPELYVPTLEQYGFVAECIYCVAVVEFEGSAELQEKAINQMENRCTLHYPECLIVTLKKQILIVGARKNDEEFVSIVKDLVKQIRPMIKKLPCYVGIGRMTKSIRCIKNSYQLAQKVVRMQKRRKSEEIIPYQKLGVYQLLMSMEDTEVIGEFCKENIDRLLEYDRVNATDLTRFLQCYFKEGANAQKTAEKLYLHRNTINYKLRKIEEILDCDLTALDTRISLSLALKLREFT